MNTIKTIEQMVEALKENHYYMLDAGLPNHSMLRKNFEAIQAGRALLEELKGQEPVAVVDANDDGYWADILPDRTVKVGQPLYTHPQPAQPKEKQCDGDFPEGFDSSVGLQAQALRAANSALFDMTGNRQWDVPCLAKHILNFKE